MVRSKAPFLLTVMAEEMGSLINDSNTTSTVDIALMVEDETNDPPEFHQDRYYFRISMITIIKDDSSQICFNYKFFLFI